MTITTEQAADGPMRFTTLATAAGMRPSQRLYLLQIKAPGKCKTSTVRAGEPKASSTTPSRMVLELAISTQMLTTSLLRMSE